MYDVAIIGGGIVGLAVGRALTLQAPGIKLCVLEKEQAVGKHQSTHNSGVLHSGLYYKPGSLKAKLCVEGRAEMLHYCNEHNIAVNQCGKVVVATALQDLERLSELERRGRANNLDGLQRLDLSQLAKMEPHATGLAGLYVPQTAVVDFGAVAESIAETLAGEVLVGAEITAAVVDQTVQLRWGESDLSAKFVINCAGLHSDRVAKMLGAQSAVRIVPFRGEYYKLAEERSDLVKALIYPVPDPKFPFLGVHFTRRIDGRVEVGPNAVLALGREYYRGRPPNLSDIAEVLNFAGFWHLGRRYWRSGLSEMWHSLSARRYSRVAQQLVPELSVKDLRPGGVGVRAQAVTDKGELVDDFVIERSPRCLHVLNAPSPGATASLAIGRHVAELAIQAM